MNVSNIRPTLHFASLIPHRCQGYCFTSHNYSFGAFLTHYTLEMSDDPFFIRVQGNIRPINLTSGEL